MEITAFRPLYTHDSSTQNEEEHFRREVLNDFYICCVSREASILARREVLTGKAKFGITGDGKEVIQVALAKAIKNGDHRAGYYRDQTLMFALGRASVQDYFAQLYADSSNDPFSAGRQMMTHFATAYNDREGNWLDHMKHFNTSSDISCTAGQMGRAVGLALASKKYREIRDIQDPTFTDEGSEIVVCSIGDGSTSEGPFWESVNAATVMQIPIAFCVWDDGYAISVPTKYQTVKGSISKALGGFLVDKKGRGMRIYKAKAKDYVGLCDMFMKGFARIRKAHQPALFHIVDTTQPLGHSTSGSHERYKPLERLKWEKEQDCIVAFSQWIQDVNIATGEELEEIRNKGIAYARQCKREAWEAKSLQIRHKRAELLGLLHNSGANGEVAAFIQRTNKLIDPELSDLHAIARQAIYHQMRLGSVSDALAEWSGNLNQQIANTYGNHLYANGDKSITEIKTVDPTYSVDSPELNGYEILNRYFNHAFDHHPNLFAFGEDVGKLGDVNQGFAGLQKKYGKGRVFDTGIREWTIVGQAIGMAMRGLRPIAEIQYLDYLVYAMAPLMDDLATLRYRSAGIQHAPALIRTRGHRLEGIWHTGSPLGMIINSLRGLYILVPRNMVQAAGMYQTWLQGSDPVLMIECLNGYRRKETLPDNLGSFSVPYGVPEILREGRDISLVTYGACVRLALEACDRLEKYDIEVEVIDVQTLIPFDLPGVIIQSIMKTNRLIFVDEDVPGGATGFMMQQVLERQGGFDFLELGARTITAKDHRPPYGSDGDYYAKPNVEDIFEEILDMMYVLDPSKYPKVDD